MEDKSRVVIVHNIISPYKTLLFNALYQRHQQMTVLYLGETEKNRQWTINRKDLRFPYEVLFNGALEDARLPQLIRLIWRRLRGLNPDVLVLDGYGYVASWAAFLWAKINRKKIVLWSSSNEGDHKRMFLKESLKRFLVRNCDAANVYGTRSREYLLKLGANKNRTFLVGNNTDSEFYARETVQLRAGKAALCREMGVPTHNFLYIGRFSAEKNLLLLLKCFHDVQRLPRMDWGLILVGDGPQKAEILNCMEEHCIANVSMPGFKQKEEIPRYLAASDVFVLPSISETWGLVVNEAMAAGLPVLVSRRCGCYPDLMREGINGFSFDPLDGTELFHCMKKMSEAGCDLAAMGQASFEAIRDYTPERAARVVMETFKLVVEGA